MITCTGCEEVLPEAEFHRSSRNKTGRSTRCRKCLTAYHNEYLGKITKPPSGSETCSSCQTPLRIDENWRPCHYRIMRMVCKDCSCRKQRAYGRSTIRETVLFHLAKQRAALKGLSFEISKSDIVIPAVCPVLGIPLAVGDRKQHDGSPTLDRIDPSKGYVKGNIAVISHRANRLKNNATLHELEAITDWVRKVSV